MDALFPPDQQVWLVGSAADGTTRRLEGIVLESQCDEVLLALPTCEDDPRSFTPGQAFTLFCPSASGPRRAETRILRALRGSFLMVAVERPPAYEPLERRRSPRRAVGVRARVTVRRGDAAGLDAEIETHDLSASGLSFTTLLPLHRDDVLTVSWWPARVAPDRGALRASAEARVVRVEPAGPVDEGAIARWRVALELSGPVEETEETTRYVFACMRQAR